MANRDEFYHRPTAPLSYWEDQPNLLAGRDLKAKGTWLAVGKNGNFSALTNYRDMSLEKQDAPSRGALVSNFVTSNLNPMEYPTSLPFPSPYNGYNLLVGNTEAMVYSNNIIGKTEYIYAGVYGLSNAFLNSPWPKVESGKEKFLTLLNTKSIDMDSLFNMMLNKKQYPMDTLPSTGVTPEIEKMLSALFIKSPDYGTRNTTLLLMDYKNRFTIEERRHNTPFQEKETRTFKL